jgi:hypothetical protein
LFAGTQRLVVYVFNQQVGWSAVNQEDAARPRTTHARACAALRCSTVDGRVSINKPGSDVVGFRVFVDDADWSQMNKS